MAVFEFLRLSLSVPRFGPLDDKKLRDPSESRREYLRYLFGSRHDFFFRRRLFSYVPVQNPMMKGEVLAGFIGKQTEALESLGPEDMFALAPATKWNAAFVVIDIADDQQVVALEKRADVGTAHSILEHLIDSRLSKYGKTAWHVNVEYITRTDNFRDAVERHRGEITELTFTFHPPNVLRGWNWFKKLDKLGKDQTNAQESEYALKNADGGLNPQGPFVESALEYAGEGAGSTKMKTGRKVVYNSREHRETEDFPEELMPREGESFKVAGAAEYLLNARRRKQRVRDDKRGKK